MILETTKLEESVTAHADTAFTEAEGVVILMHRSKLERNFPQAITLARIKSVFYRFICLFSLSFPITKQEIKIVLVT